MGSITTEMILLLCIKFISYFSIAVAKHLRRSSLRKEFILANHVSGYIQGMVAGVGGQLVTLTLKVNPGNPLPPVRLSPKGSTTQTGPPVWNQVFKHMSLWGTFYVQTKKGWLYRESK